MNMSRTIFLLRLTLPKQIFLTVIYCTNAAIAHLKYVIIYLEKLFHPQIRAEAPFPLLSRGPGVLRSFPEQRLVVEVTLLKPMDLARYSTV